MQIQTKDSQITVSENGITTTGIYFTYLNGYMSKQSGRHFINKNDFLVAKVVRDRNKKVMFGFVTIGLAFTWLYNWLYGKVKGFFGIEKLSDIKERAEQAQKLIEQAQSGLFYVVIVLLIAVLVAGYGFLIYYVLNNRKYLELTFIGGTIRVGCKGVDKEKLREFVGVLNKRGA